MPYERKTKTPIDTTIDRGFSFARWKKLEETAIPGFNEQMGIGDGARSPDILRVDYSIIDELAPDDSVFIPARYGISESRAAGCNRGYKKGWFVITRRTYEKDQLGIRIFRIW